MKATDHLINDHKYILRALNVLDQMSEQAAQGAPVDNRDVEDLLRFLELFADRHHQSKEESVLFPAIVGDGHHDEYPKVCQMVFEHNQERSLVEGLQESLQTRKTKDFVFFANRLVHILRTHIYKEDHILFELANSILTKEQDEALLREFEDFERLWRKTVFDGLVHRLNNLEWKYLCRTPESVALRTARA
jgi:hemerythrin-like domain-containing protein